MIRIKFYDNGDMQLDIEKKIGGLEIYKDDFLTANILFLEFGATDNEADLEDHCVHWFSSKQELTSVSDIEKLLYSKMQNNFIQEGN